MLLVNVTGFSVASIGQPVQRMCVFSEAQLSITPSPFQLEMCAII